MPSGKLLRRDDGAGDDVGEEQHGGAPNDREGSSLR